RRGRASEWAEVEGPLHASWPPPGHAGLSGTLDLATAGRADAERLVREFLPRAFRRPVSEDEVRHYLKIYDGASESEGAGGFLAGARLALKAALCPPNLLLPCPP